MSYSILNVIRNKYLEFLLLKVISHSVTNVKLPFNYFLRNTDFTVKVKLLKMVLSVAVLTLEV